METLLRSKYCIYYELYNRVNIKMIGHWSDIKAKWIYDRYCLNKRYSSILCKIISILSQFWPKISLGVANYTVILVWYNEVSNRKNDDNKKTNCCPIALVHIVQVITKSFGKFLHDEILRELKWISFFGYSLIPIIATSFKTDYVNRPLHNEYD